MSNFDRAFIKAFDKTENETTKPTRRASTRDVLLSISLRNQQGQTQRIEQPVAEEQQTHLGGPHLAFPISMAIGQQDVAIPESTLAASSVIVLPLAESEPRSKPGERRDEEEKPNPELNQDPGERQNINLDEIRRIRELEEQRAQRARARKLEEARKQEEARRAEEARRELEARKQQEAIEQAEQIRAQQILSISQPITTYVDTVSRGEEITPQTIEQPEIEQPAIEEPGETIASSDQPQYAEAPTAPTAAATDEAATPPSGGWEAAWELDRIEWPSMSDRLLGAQIDYFAEAGDQLRDSTRDGLKVLAISSELRGEGRTTLALCLARAAAAAGVRVAVLDADVSQPSLASTLNLSEIPGWNEVLDGRTPLAEAAVTSLEDGVSIFPLADTTGAISPSNSGVSTLIRRIADQFELLIVDSGPLGDEHTGMFEGGERCPIDAAVIVRDVRRSEVASLTHNIRLWRAIGVNAVGVVENFLPLDESAT